MSEIVTFAPVCQTPEVLEKFLPAVLATAPGPVWLADDNDDPASSELLQRSGARVIPVLEPKTNKYDSHRWNEELIGRVARMKQDAILAAYQWGLDIMLVDSDLVLQPETVKHLDSLNLPVTCEVFWTRWKDSWPAMPNAWDRHPFFIEKSKMLTLRHPGQYTMRALGACTLLRWEAIEKGAHFAPLHSLRWGEDRWFSMRAECAGIPLVLDTCYPAHHLYRGPGTPPCLPDDEWQRRIRWWGGLEDDGWIGIVPPAQPV